MKRFHDEHIVPLALNGALILSEASCQQCERIINREIENCLLTEEYARFRAKYGLPTRRPRNRKKTVKLPSITGGWIKVPATEYTAPVPLYRFKMARILSGVPPIPNSHAWTMDILGGGDEEVCLQKKFPLWTGVVAGIGVGLIAEHFVTSLDFPDAAQIQRCPAAQV